MAADPGLARRTAPGGRQTAAERRLIHSIRRAGGYLDSALAERFFAGAMQPRPEIWGNCR